MTAARMWAAPISSGILPNFSPWEQVIMESVYVNRFAVEEVSAAISRAAKELGYG